MTASIRIESLIGQTRAAAFAQDGRPFSLFIQRHHDTRAHWHGVYPARVRKLSRDQGGGYAELNQGEEVFIPSAKLGGLTEGAETLLRIEAAARIDKLARGAPVRKPSDATPLALWVGSLPDAVANQINTDGPDELVEAAFDEAISTTAPIPGGGVLHMHETPALTAIDIDSAGRQSTGSATDRAKKLNLAALREAARQIALCGQGGLVAIDCVAPLPRTQGSELKKVFLQSFRTFDTRKGQALAPSPFGLLEASFAWRWPPIRHTLLDSAGSPRIATLIWQSLRELEVAATADRMGRYTLSLPEAWGVKALDRTADLSKALSRRYGGRLHLVDAASDAPHLARHDS